MLFLVISEISRIFENQRAKLASVIATLISPVFTFTCTYLQILDISPIQRTTRVKGTSPLSSPWMIPIGLNDCCNGTLQLQKALNSMVNYQVTHCLNLKFFKVSDEGGAVVKSA